jgi:hypothetical protein
LSAGGDCQSPVFCYAVRAGFVPLLESFRGFWKMVNVITFTKIINITTSFSLPEKDWPISNYLSAP